jgi:phage regulator Rha-like protein
MNDIALTTHKGEARIDSRLLAERMKLRHHSAFEMVKDFKAEFEQLGVIRFQTEQSPQGSSGGRPERYALLNEDQCYLLLAFSRNTLHVRALKVALVKAFRQARQGQQITEAEYLPGYHALHERAHELAAGSENERFVHMNLNKLVNRAVGIEPGQRSTLAAPARSLTATAQIIAVRAMTASSNHHDGYQAARAALGRFQQLIDADRPLAAIGSTA